jgi:hypothetical protein
LADFNYRKPVYGMQLGDKGSGNWPGINRVVDARSRPVEGYAATTRGTTMYL